MKISRLTTLVLCLTSLLAIPGTAKTSVQFGCFYCKPVAPVGMGSSCHSVGANQNGDGWKCTETNDLPWPDGPSCYVDGGACFNSAGGGAGGGSGGGSGSSCQVSGFCPAECFSCGSSGGRPAV